MPRIRDLDGNFVTVPDSDPGGTTVIDALVAELGVPTPTNYRGVVMVPVPNDSLQVDKWVLGGVGDVTTSPSGLPYPVGTLPFVVDHGSFHDLWAYKDPSWQGPFYSEQHLHIYFPRPVIKHYTDVSNGTTVETSLYDDSIGNAPASMPRMGFDGDSLDLDYSGVFAGHATATQQLKLYFAGTAIFDSGALAITAASNWRITGKIIRVSNTVVRYVVTLTTPGLTAEAIQSTGELTGLNFTNNTTSAYHVKVTAQAAGTGAASAQTTAKMGVVVYNP